jgi:hypothetical protein
MNSNMWTGQRRATRGFLLVSAAALTVPAVIVGWLGWLLLQSDRELDRQRVQERLTNAAILAIASLEQTISTTEQRLTALASAEGSVRPPTCRRSPTRGKRRRPVEAVM